MYVKLNNFALHLKLTQHCKSTILQFFKKNYKNYLYEKLGWTISPLRLLKTTILNNPSSLSLKFALFLKIMENTYLQVFPSIYYEAKENRVMIINTENIKLTKSGR